MHSAKGCPVATLSAEVTNSHSIDDHIAAFATSTTVFVVINSHSMGDRIASQRAGS